jgi:hypothetical protein
MVTCRSIKRHPVAFGVITFRYQGKKIMLNERTFFVDGV